MTNECDKGRRYRVEPIDCYKVYVRDGRLDGVVDFHTHECTFKEFDSIQIPCSNAIVAAKERDITPHSICNNKYSVDVLITSYADPILPLGHVSE